MAQEGGRWLLGACLATLALTFAAAPFAPEEVLVTLALALLLPFLFVLWRRRMQRRSIVTALFAPEHLAAAAVVLAYG